MKAAQQAAPNTPEQRQAVRTLKSAKDVLGEINALSRVLRKSGGDRGERVLAKRDLFDASDRMCNLLALASRQAEMNLGGKMQDQLTQELNVLRDRLIGMGTLLVVEKFRKINARLEEVLTDGNYPLGLCRKLGLTMTALNQNLELLGGEDSLSAEDRTVVERTRARFAHLEEFEKGLGVFATAERRPALVAAE